MRHDDATAEMLIQHFPLREVLAFVNAREDVRDMSRTVIDVEPETTREAGEADTIPVPGATTAPPHG